MSTQTLAEQWKFFENFVLGQDPKFGPMQREEMRKAFYAGAAKMLSNVMDATSLESEEESNAMLDGYLKEVVGYAHALNQNNPPAIFNWNLPHDSSSH